MIQEYINKPEELSKDVKDMVLSGDVNPLLVKVMFDVFSDAMKDKEIKDAILSEADKHEKEFSIGHFNFTKSSRTTYDYKHDSEWQRIEKEKKDREKLMKLAMDQEVVDAKTGEVVEPAVKRSTEFIKRTR